MLTLDDETLLRFLKEDVPYGDLTTRSLGINSEKSIMTFHARTDMCIAAIEEAERLLSLIGCDVQSFGDSGALIQYGTHVLTARGSAEKIFMGWKVSQTLVEWTSGVATAASTLVQKSKAINPNCVIACTRKSIAGTRELAARAVLSAGAVMHRNGLSDTVLLFPEHLEFAKTSNSLEEQIKFLKKQCPERSIVVEVKNTKEAQIALDTGANVIQLEKFTPEDISKLVQEVSGKYGAHIAAAGGINPDNVEEYAKTGADILVTSSPYYAKPVDIQVKITKAD